MEACYRFLAPDLERLETVLDSAFAVDGELMGEVAAYVRAQRGKLLRPMVTFLSARAHGHDLARGDQHIALGAAVELFHTATLLHDDVIDKAPVRRGRPTVNARWNDDVAILFADYLYATSFDLALSAMRPDVLRLLTKTTQQMTEGEFLQVERRGQSLSEADYLEIIHKKTAYLFAASAALGALAAEGSEADAERMAQFGLNFGVAFQITDDTLDYEASTDQMGKKTGADLAEGKQTLPLVRTLAVASAEDRAVLEAVLSNGREFSTVHRFVDKYAGIDYSLEVAGNYCRQAQEALAPLGPDNEPAALLRQLAEVVLVRQS